MKTDTPLMFRLLDETRMPCRISDGPQEPGDEIPRYDSMDEPEDFSRELDEFPDTEDCPECGRTTTAMSWYSTWFQCDCGHFWILSNYRIFEWALAQWMRKKDGYDAVRG